MPLAANLFADLSGFVGEQDACTHERCERRDMRGAAPEAIGARQPGQVKEPMKPAIICDIDGTLADMGTRSPYDFEKVDQDEVKHATAETVRVFARAGYAIILFSGRDDSSRDMTITWLKANDVPFDELVMRRTGDRRKDSKVKREMYERTVPGTYDVLLVLDDRNQVVDMWRRELGLACFQVDYGNF